MLPTSSIGRIPFDDWWSTRNPTSGDSPAVARRALDPARELPGGPTLGLAATRQ